MNRKPRGLTLLELVVVLAILAVVTGIAVASLSSVEDSKRLDASILQLEQIRNSTVGEPDARDTDGTPVNRSFVGDIGRLPRTAQRTFPISGGGTEDALTLDELWIGPTAPNELYQLRIASGTNLDATSTAYPDTSIYVGTGWRGPYITLGALSDRLRDGYGTLIENPFPATVDSPAKSFLRSGIPPADAPITAANQPVEVIRMAGANALILPGDTGLSSNEPVLNVVAAAAADIEGNVTVVFGDPLPGGISSFKIQVRLYAPSPTELGKIKVTTFNARNELVGGGSNNDEFTASTNSVISAKFEFTGQTVGPRALRAYLVDSVTGSIIYLRSNIRRMLVRQGENDCSLECKN